MKNNTNTIKYAVMAILDENGNNIIGKDEFPLDKNKFLDLLEKAEQAGEVYKTYSFMHEGKTIMFTWKFV